MSTLNARKLKDVAAVIKAAREDRGLSQVLLGIPSTRLSMPREPDPLMTFVAGAA